MRITEGQSMQFLKALRASMALHMLVLAALLGVACGGTETTSEPTATAAAGYTAATYTEIINNNPCQGGTVVKTQELPFGPTTGLCGITHLRARLQGGDGNDNGTGTHESGWIVTQATDGNWSVKTTTMCGDYIDVGWSCEPWSNFREGAPVFEDLGLFNGLTPPTPGVFDTAHLSHEPEDDLQESFELPMSVFGDFTAQSPNDYAGVYDGNPDADFIFLNVGSRVDEIGATAANYRWSSIYCPAAYVNYQMPVRRDGRGDLCRWVPDGDNDNNGRDADRCGVGGNPTHQTDSCSPGLATPTGGPSTVSCFMQSMQGPFGQSHQGLYGGFDIAVPSSGYPVLNVVGTELEGTPTIDMTCIEKLNF